ncbi:hypothetical protein Glove_349g68 [Diversispora epigaea]|uniref:Uncharacterized protein n=1 Tax=Diversispora epigaea TaxID=1348612 RepID=A0A397HGU1_9GLOM|nr:hypothetical protein Glove_349g68 [Diversispora epigaea]
MERKPLLNDLRVNSDLSTGLNQSKAKWNITDFSEMTKKFSYPPKSNNVIIKNLTLQSSIESTQSKEKWNIPNFSEMIKFVFK